MIEVIIDLGKNKVIKFDEEEIKVYEEWSEWSMKIEELFELVREKGKFVDD